MYRASPWCVRGLLTVLVSFALRAPAAAQEVAWQLDYNRARQEAQEQGRPLVIELATENCVWCRQLEQRTFKDPAVIGLLNDYCVPLRVDAQRTPELAEALRIQNFPTLVFAGPDGRILGYQEGFVDAPRLKELLQRTVGAVATPEWMKKDYEEAVRAHAGRDYARAVARLKNVLDDGKDRPVQHKARQLLADIEQQAANRQTLARQLAEKNRRAEAIEVVHEMLRVFPGTQSAWEANQWLTSLPAPAGDHERLRAERARDLLRVAREDYRSQQFGCCLDRCEVLLAQYADLPEGVEAGQLAAEIKSNPEWLKSACDQLGERLGVLYLTLAESWLKKGQPQQAVYYLDRVVQTFPNSRHAEAAQLRLSQVQGLPARSVDLKK